MRILFVIASLGVGGAERLLLNLAVHLKARGVESMIVSVSSIIDAVDDMIPRPEIVTLEFDSNIFDIHGMKRASRTLASIVAEYKPDVVHSNVYIADILSWISVPCGVPLISTLHGVDAWWLNRRRLLSRLKTMSYMILARMRHVRFIAVSEDVRQQAESVAGLSGDRIIVIANGVDTEWFAPQGNDASRPFSIVQVGRFVPEKGHQTAIRALANLKRSKPLARLVLVGAGPLRSECEALATTLGVRSEVEFVGRQSDVRPWLWAASVFWMPSETEGLPLACLEAMSCGLPIVASDVGGLPEIVDSTCGYIVRRGDPEELSKVTSVLMDDPAYANALGQAARRKVQRCYSLDKAADEYVAAYKGSGPIVWK
ncbi:MAG: glycosyltransferase family 4 protein [Nitrospira sp.]